VFRQIEQGAQAARLNNRAAAGDSLKLAFGRGREGGRSLSAAETGFVRGTEPVHCDARPQDRIADPLGCSHRASGFVKKLPTGHSGSCVGIAEP
jgi:hypothetical protein